MMEQISFNMGTTDSIDIQSLQDAFGRLIPNPKATKFLAISENKDKSISIKAFSVLVAQIKLIEKNMHLVFRSKYDNFFINWELKPSSKGYSRIELKGTNTIFELIDPLSSIYMKLLSEHAEEPFGCCSRYVECSDALECLHPNYLFSLSCAYKKNLELGRIFYGKNKNIER